MVGTPCFLRDTEWECTKNTCEQHCAQNLAAAQKLGCLASQGTGSCQSAQAEGASGDLREVTWYSRNVSAFEVTQETHQREKQLQFLCLTLTACSHPAPWLSGTHKRAGRGPFLGLWSHYRQNLAVFLSLSNRKVSVNPRLWDLCH